MTENNESTNLKVSPGKFERHKAFNEYLRFITTLSTGSLVLLTSFSEKITSTPKLGFLMGLSLIAFMVSILGAVLAYTITTIYFGMEILDNSAKIMATGVFFAWVSFLVAIASLTIFALVNFY